jgi:hypothetical protein
MTSYERINERTPSGGAYSEIFYFDEDGELADKSQAVRCVIRECAENGDLINEIFGAIEKPYKRRSLFRRIRRALFK